MSLKIRVMCFNQEINRQRLLIKFKIKPPFWSTTGFLITILIIVFLVVILVVNFYFRREKTKNKINQERIELKQKVLRSQLNSHFIFNTLSAIQYSITKNPIEETKKQIENFASLLRNVLEKSDYSLFPISKEIELIEKVYSNRKL